MNSATSTSSSGTSRTLRGEATLSGIGLHSGAHVTARLQPRHKSGLVFARADMPGVPVVAASWRCVMHTTHATTLGINDATVSTTEHLLAALWALGVTCCRIELDGPEVPILDGSSLEWCRLIAKTGVVEAANVPCRPVYTLREPVWVEEGQSSLLALPSDTLRLSWAVDFAADCARHQMVDVVVTPESFVSDLAPARTFALEEWIEPLRAQGLVRGGSLEAAIILRKGGPSSPFRFSNELARHKALDAVGDLALMFGENGGILGAHLIGVRAGHALHRRWIEECMERDALVQIDI